MEVQSKVENWQFVHQVAGTEPCSNLNAQIWARTKLSHQIPPPHCNAYISLSHLFSSGQKVIISSRQSQCSYTNQHSIYSSCYVPFSMLCSTELVINICQTNRQCLNRQKGHSRHRCYRWSKCVVGACVVGCGVVLSNLGTLPVPPLGGCSQPAAAHLGAQALFPPAPKPLPSSLSHIHFQ